MKKMNIGILGLGTVGGGTYDILNMNKSLIIKRTGVDYQIKKILCKNPKRIKEHDIDSSIITENPEDIISNDDIDIVVEAIGGIEPALSWIKKSMENKKHVVTPNKAVVAENFLLLNNLAKENNVEFKMEACVAGGIPILTSITEALSGNEFSEVLGIFNGTTNYILSKMTDENLPYEVALKDAQNKGFAESDPTSDVEGIDIANKLSIIIALAFGDYIHPSDIPTKGITQITKKDIDIAKNNNSKIKLIGSVKKDKSGNLSYNISPTEISYEHPLANVNNEFNGVFINGNAVGEVMLYGKGAGALPTGSAIVGDIISILKKSK